MDSIIKACHSNKIARHWFNNESTKELIKSFGTDDFVRTEKLYENRVNLANNLKGYYVHEDLVYSIAIWASPKYARYVFQILKDLAAEYRNSLQNHINELQGQINTQSQEITVLKNNNLKKHEQCVPNDRKKNFSYLLYSKGSLDNDFVDIKIVCIKTRYLKKEQLEILKSGEFILYIDDLPTATSINENIIKHIIPAYFKQGIHYNKTSLKYINFRASCLEKLKSLICEYIQTYE